MKAIEAKFPFTKCMLCILARSTRIFSRRPEPSSAEIRLSLFRDNDPQFLPSIEGKGEAMLGLWMSVVYAGTLPDMEEA